MDLEHSPLTLQDAARETIKAAMRRGSPISDALRFAGVPRRTFRTWEKIGREELERCIEAGTEPEPHLAPYVEFVEALEAARSEGVNVLLNRIWDASRETTDTDGTVISRGSWQAAAWLLERTDPTHFARRIELVGDGEGARRPKVDEIDALSLFQQRIDEINARRGRVIETTASEVDATPD